jgi:hypothetical protein
MVLIFSNYADLTYLNTVYQYVTSVVSTNGFGALFVFYPTVLNKMDLSVFRLSLDTSMIARRGKII